MYIPKMGPVLGFETISYAWGFYALKALRVAFDTFFGLKEICLNITANYKK
jgi:hypothetical protein